mmetsp:Transcript_18444/g.31553  ORF Transcript_18444/g.31553 Transcript_18444/m.31553 type:complete len:90 (+) Transcript_18444:367-636(+)
MRSLCSYAQQNRFTDQQLLDLCMAPASELPKDSRNAWCVIAEALPNRSVQSIHNFCRRRFNANNYSGKWSKAEEAAMLDLVKQLGPSWK